MNSRWRPLVRRGLTARRVVGRYYLPPPTKRRALRIALVQSHCRTAGVWGLGARAIAVAARAAIFCTPFALITYE
jgi:hypothetical protein